MAATLIAATRGFAAFMAAAVAATTEEGAADLAAANVAAVDTAAEGVAAASWAAPGAAAPAAAPSLLLSACCSRLLLFFSLLLSLGGRFLPRQRVAGALDTVAAADEEMPLQQKFNSSSPSTVSRVRRAHLLSLLHLLYRFRRVAKGGEGLCPAEGGELFLAVPADADGSTPPLPTTSAHEGAIVVGGKGGW